MIGTILGNRYAIHAVLGEGASSVVYRALDARCGRTVAVKSLRAGTISGRPEDGIRLKNEAVMASRLNHPGIVSVHEVLQSPDGRLHIVMDYIDAQSLDAYMRERGESGLPLDESFEIVAAICRVLERVHQGGIVHRDLKPGNILIAPKSAGALPDEGFIKLIDFGLSAAKEYAWLSDMSDDGDNDGTGHFAGTVRYMAPEQFRLSPRELDQRADLYSLGVILYELLTGRPPFVAANASSMIHQHMAKNPASLTTRNPSIPPLVDSIVLKLLSKDPDDRYQTAAGLLRDIRKFQSGVDFIPGQSDRPMPLSFESDLVGRDEEFSFLAERLSLLQGGVGSLVLLNAEAGMGKTMLARAFRRFVFEQKTIFLTGACFPGESKIPYGPITYALDGYLRQYQRFPLSRRREIVDRLSREVGGLGALLQKLNPDLASLFPDAPVPVGLDPGREKSRFIMTVERFIMCIAEMDGLVMLIEDLQWCDEGSLELLEALARSLAEHPLMIIATCRESEVPYSGNLRRFLVSMHEGKGPFAVQTLRPFGRDQLLRFIAGIVHGSPHDTLVRSLADFVGPKSGGNPLFAREVIKQLFHERALEYDQEYALRLDHTRLGNVDISASLADMVLRQVSQLDTEEKTVLSFAAIVGKEFEISLMIDLFAEMQTKPDGAVRGADLGPDEIIAAIDRAIALHFLLEDRQIAGRIAFAHDSIRDAFYRLADDAVRRRVHRGAARAIEERARDSGNDPDGAVLFSLAYHHIEAGDIEQSLVRSYPAGLRAMEAHAYQDALYYLNHARECLEILAKRSDDAAANREQALAIEVLIGEVLLVIGKSDEAAALYEKLAAMVASDHDRAYAFKQLSQAYFKKGDWKSCERYGRTGLKILHEWLPRGAMATIASLVREFGVHLVQAPFRDLLLRKNRAKPDVRHRLIIWFYYGLGWSYVLNDSIKFARLLLRMLNIAERYLGPSRELGISLAGYGVLCSSIYRFERSLRYHDLSLRMRIGLGDEWGIAQSHQLIGFCYYFWGRLQKSMEHYEISIERFTRIGDLKELGNSLSGIIWIHLIRGDYPAARSGIERFHDIAERIQDDFSICYAYFYRGSYFFNIGDFTSAREYFDRAIARARDKEIWGLLCMATADLGRLFAASGDIGAARAEYERAREIELRHNVFRESTAYRYYEYADAGIEDYRDRLNRGPMNRPEKSAALRAIKQACVHAVRRNRRSCLNKGSALRVMAKYHAVAGNRTAAERYFRRSLACFEHLDFAVDRARALFDYGVFLHEAGDTMRGRALALDAYGILLRIGNQAYVQKPRAFLQISDTTVPHRLPVAYQRIKEKVKVDSIMALVRDMSAGQDIAAVLDKALAVLLEMTGAGRGYILRTTDEGPPELLASLSLNPEDAGEFSESVIARVIETGEAVLGTNAEEEGDFSDQASISNHGLISILAVPIFFKGRSIGVCYLDNRFSSGMFGPDDIETVQLIMQQVSLSFGISMLEKNVDQLSDIEPTDDFCRRYGITRRERELIILLLKGLDNAEITARLGISLSTVEKHLISIYAKTGVRGKVKLINLIRDSL